ncbi:MAG: tryptophan synthase subunit alpha [Candidatus Eisenbacteria sp.]|nr:tryptophan synthase subunit alpha [Candidatus Eisenbacteria bacterium]
MMLRDLTRSLKTRGEKGLAPFLTAGFPDDETFLRLLGAASSAGCRMIEIGIPFSDPIADGPVIQESSKRALEAGMTLRKALALAEKASKTVPAALVFMSYFNPILRMGLEEFSGCARRCGVSGVIVPDVPVEEAGEIRRALSENGIPLIDLVAPTSSGSRIERIASAADGFLYLVSVTGVTGVRSALSGDLGGFVERVRERTELPLYVGFGVSTPEEARETARHADGVIVGSALIRIIQGARTNDEAVEKVGAFLKNMKQAMNESGRS